MTKIRNLWFFAASVLALVPLFFYVQNLVLLWLLLFVYLGAYLFVIRETSLVAQSILNTEKSKKSVPRIFAHSERLSKWWLLLSHTWRLSLGLFLPRFGIALAVSQFLNFAAVWRTPFLSLTPYAYTNYPTYNEFGQLITTNLLKDPEIYLMGAISLFLFVIAEQALLSALALANRGFTRLLIARGLVFFVTMGFIFVNLEIFTWENFARFASFGCGGGPACEYYCHQAVLRVNETIHTALMSTADGGILQTTNLIRPYSYPWLTMPLEIPHFAWYLLRQIVASGLGIAVYMLWTMAALKWHKSAETPKNIIILSPDLQ